MRGGSGTAGLPSLSSHHPVGTWRPCPNMGPRGRGSLAQPGPPAAQHVSESFSQVRTAFFSFLIAAPLPSTRSGLSREAASALLAAPAPEPARRRKALHSGHLPHSEKGTGPGAVTAQSPQRGCHRAQRGRAGPVCSLSQAWGGALTPAWSPLPVLLLILLPCGPFSPRERKVMSNLCVSGVAASALKM